MLSGISMRMNSFSKLLMKCCFHGGNEVKLSGIIKENERSNRTFKE